ncbi:hypothetical protein ACFLYU_05810 [Candidatus Dependentiae bacterium]
MALFKRFQKGFETATKSFSILWEHKKLLIYLGIPIVLGVLVEILIYNIKLDPSSICTSFSQKDAIARILKLDTSYSWLRYMSVIFAYFIYLAIVTLANMSLTKHTYAICKKERIGLRKIVTWAISKIKLAIIWTFFMHIPIITFHMINSHILKSPSLLAKSFYALITLSIFVTWSIITLFVIQAIAIDNAGVKAAIKSSILSVKKIFSEYLGAMLWIVLTGTIFTIPFIVLERFVNAIYFFAIPMVLLIYCYISSTYTVSKTLLYIDSKKK